MRIIPIYGIQVNVAVDDIAVIAYRVVSDSNDKAIHLQGSYEDCKKYIENRS